MSFGAQYRPGHVNAAILYFFFNLRVLWASATIKHFAFENCNSLKKKREGTNTPPFCFWWSWGGSNSWPLECHSSALPAELQPRYFSNKRMRLLPRAFINCQQILAWHFASRLYNRARAGVVKLVDAGDSKSPARKGISVRFRAPAPIHFNVLWF